MAFEKWARQIIETELNRPVVVHDDGRQPSMYDLRIGSIDAPEMAIECVGAVDPIRTETWNVGPAKGPLCLAVKGNWIIIITPNAHLRAIKQRIEPLLQELEERGLCKVRVDDAMKEYDSRLFYELESLGIRRASCFRLTGAGRVYMTMEPIGGVVDSAGSTLPQWIGEFLRDPRQADVLSKLYRSGAAERHVFVLVDFGGAPWSVKSYLTSEIYCLPAAEPNLPSPVTGVWLASTLGTHGVRWDNTGWQLFKARDELR